ncbi:MAG: hypothetical protein LBR47_00540 [Spirochaetaceae bacterium]|jgi:hypothetical protein|nr:hypothetical protein [Spirochaetaceae bacterium]
MSLLCKRFCIPANRFLFLIILAASILAATVLWCSCIEPSPLYGSWADNRGDKLSLFSDNTFSASMMDPVEGKLTYDGEYTVLLNSLVLSCSTGKQIVSEWDIRGNMLYLNWTSEEGVLIPLTLYKTAN